MISSLLDEKEAQAVALVMEFASFIRKYASMYHKDVKDFKELYLDFSIPDEILEAVLLKFIFEDQPLQSVLGFGDDQSIIWKPGMTAKDSHFNLFEYQEGEKTVIGKLFLWAKTPVLEAA